MNEQENALVERTLAAAGTTCLWREHCTNEATVLKVACVQTGRVHVYPLEKTGPETCPRCSGPTKKVE